MPTGLDADAFTEAFARHGRALWLVASAWVGRDAAADLVQETARIAWQRRDQFRRGSDIAAWLAQIVRHTGANWRRQRRPRLLDELPEPDAPAPPPVAWALDADGLDLPDDLARALGTLSEVGRACLLLHIVGELPFATIATMLDLNENTAMSHARRAREQLRAALGTNLPTPKASTP